MGKKTEVVLETIIGDVRIMVRGDHAEDVVAEFTYIQEAMPKKEWTPIQDAPEELEEKQD